jgi:hypothetical protein
MLRSLGTRLRYLQTHSIPLTITLRSPFATMSSPGSDWTLVPAQDSRPAYHVFSKPIDKSPQDDRQYRLVQLENGLNAILVSDPKGDKAAASLDVAVGHLDDPVRVITIRT